MYEYTDNLNTRMHPGKTDGYERHFNGNEDEDYTRNTNEDWKNKRKKKENTTKKQNKTRTRFSQYAGDHLIAYNLVQNISRGCNCCGPLYCVLQNSTFLFTPL